MFNPVDYWFLDRSTGVLQICDEEMNARVKKWGFVTRRLVAGMNFFMMQYTFPRSKTKLICKLLGITHEKNPGRVAAGKQAAKTHPIRRGEQCKLEF